LHSKISNIFVFLDEKGYCLFSSYERLFATMRRCSFLQFYSSTCSVCFDVYETNIDCAQLWIFSEGLWVGNQTR